ncbi:5-(carboxyamino)imidazole ribonucleotide synthase [Ligilactobacillus sp. WC1T17]|uniref:5-(carboxyamino)imidazole ribonucleotide synthase n=1 Tax=Ligilactobacillus sp. WC1T17 TaxID=3158786 RepID=UPI00094D35A0
MIKRKRVVINLSKMIEQGKTIGIIGGGQLGQMLALSAKQAGMYVNILDPNPHCSAGQVADELIVAAYDDQQALAVLAKKSDVLTYEFENVDLDALEAVAQFTYLPQGTELLKITKDRILEKSFLQKHGLKTAPFRAVNNSDDLTKGLEELGYPSILKTCQGGYDGKAQYSLKTVTDIKEAKALLEAGPCILEGFVAFSMECSVMVGRNADGEVAVFPVSENIHRNHILHESIVPARISSTLQKKAQEVAENVARALNLCGILGVEMFIGKDQEIYINELAPRPHNSGHYSIEACNFSQFAVHNRAILNWPLPQIELLSPVVMVNVLGQHVDGVKQLIKQKPQWHFHDYCKDLAKVDRKMGHVTILTRDVEKTLAEIKTTKVWD